MIKNKNSSPWLSFDGCVVLLILSLFAFYLICKPIIALTTQDVVVITVTDKERVSSNWMQSSRYLIWTKGEVFENTDVMVFGKYNSSDLYGQLEIGGTYEVLVVGYRVPMASAYRNIIRINERIE